MDKQTQEKLLEIVRRNYNEIAGEFSETRKELWPTMKELGNMVREGGSVLDAGCGNGRLLEAFKNKKIEYTGVDSSKNLIQLAEAKYQELNQKSKIKNPKFIVADILDLSQIKNKFDWVFSIAALHHFPGEDLQVKALSEMKNKIKENGKIVISVWKLWNQPKYLKLIAKFAALKIFGKNKMGFGDIIFDWGGEKGRKKSQRYYHAFRKRELKKIIKKAGLKIEKIYQEKYDYYVILTK